MSVNYNSVVNSFYIAYYGRPADPGGLAFWSHQLDNANGDFSAIINAFATSPEATVHFGTGDAEASITQVYEQLFNRAPEQEGLHFWIDAIQNGHMTLASAAIEIMHGAQGTDADLSTMRQQVAAQFTAEVTNSGSTYDGTAANNAARLLIQAVNPNTSQSDVAAMVKSASALADVASHTPAVLDALGTGSALGALFSSAQGKAQPVQLMQTLADVAEAAAGNPATLDSLLRGGGMAKVLDAMPSGVSLNNVIDALAHGGLSAAVDVVYPPAPAPAPAPKAGTLSFADLAGGSGTSLPPTNNPMPTLALNGNDPGTTVEYQISHDGNTWVRLQDIGAQPDGTYYYRARVTDAAGHASLSNVIGELLDRTAPLPVALSLGATDRQLALGESLSLMVRFSEAVRIDSNAAPTITLNNGGTATYAGGSGTNVLMFRYTPQAGEDVDQLKTAATGALHGTVLDRAGNAVAATACDGLAPTGTVRVDTVAPQQVLTVHTVDQQAGASFEANGATPLMTNLATTALHATLSAPLGTDEYIEYSLDNGATWQTTHLGVDGLQVTVSAIDATANPTVTLRLSDTAGNHAPTVSQAIGYDNAAPALGTVSLASITHAAADSAPADNLTNAGTADIQLSFTGTLAAGDSLQYSTDGTTWHAVSPDSAGGTATINGLDLTSGTPDSDGNLTQTLLLRAIDSAGNASTTSSTSLVYDNHIGTPAIALATDNGVSNSDHVTSVATLSLTGIETGARVEYSLDGSTAWSATVPTAVEGQNTVYVRQIDAAGNVSAAAGLTFNYDTQTPVTPTLALVTDSGSDSHDGLTNVGTILVDGLEHGNGTTWEYSTDGQTWQPGTQVNEQGQATLALSGDGATTLIVRQADLAGHASGDATLSFTLDTTAPPSLSFGQVEGASAGTPNVTALSTADVTFNFDGTLSGSDTVQYRIGGGAWTDVSGSAGSIDTVAKTITINDLDLSASDPTIGLRIVDQAGNQTSASQAIDGPYQDLHFTMAPTASGLQVTSSAAAIAYLNSNGSAIALTSTSGGNAVAGTTTFGFQGAVLQGTLSLGQDANSALADQNGVRIAFGTNASETLTGQYVWGFGGNDTLIGTGGNDALYGGADGGSIFQGGLGADSITMQGNNNQLIYTSVAESHVLSGSGPAAGFDTVTTPDLGLAPTYRKLIVDLPDSIQFWNFGSFASMTDPNGSGDALLSAFNNAIQAYGAANGATPEPDGRYYSPQVMVFNVSDMAHYLVIDDGNGIIGSEDYVVKIIGKIGDFCVDFDNNKVVVGTLY